MKRELLIETEQNILGYAIRTGNPIFLADLCGKFLTDEHNDIAEALLSLYRDDVKIDILSVAEKLNHIETHKLAHLITVSVILEPDHSVKLVNDEWKKRELKRILRDVDSRIDLEDSKTLIGKTTDDLILLGTNTEKRPTLEAAFEEMEEEMMQSIAAKESGRGTIGIKTGYKIDGMADGLRPSHLWTIAAYTSAGKTTLSVNIARFILEGNYRVVMYSLESSKTDLMTKFVSLDSYMPTRLVLHSADNDKDYESFKKSKEHIMKNYQLSIYDDKFDIDDLVLSMRQENSKKHVDAFFLDYIQNVTCRKISDEYSRITYAMSVLKQTLRAVNSPMIIFSQISNEDSKAKNSLLMNGKGSGAIKSASSLFAYMKTIGTDEEILNYYKTGEDVPIELIVNKNQHGRLGTIRMKRKQETGEIYEY